MANQFVVQLKNTPGAMAVLAEELARIGSGGVAAGLGAHISIATPPIWKFGSEEQKQRYLTPMAKGEKLGCFGLTEPAAGSDVAAMLSTAIKQPDGTYRLNGQKSWISYARRAKEIVSP